MTTTAHNQKMRITQIDYIELAKRDLDDLVQMGEKAYSQYGIVLSLSAQASALIALFERLDAMTANVGTNDTYLDALRINRYAGGAQ